MPHALRDPGWYGAAPHLEQVTGWLRSSRARLSAEDSGLKGHRSHNLSYDKTISDEV